MKKIISFIMVSLLLFAGGIPLAHAADDVTTTVPTHVNITVHKLMYDKNVTLDVIKDGILNNGHEQSDYPTGVTAYDKAQYGRVGFTLYNITNAFSDKNYTDSKISNIVADVETKGIDSSYIKNSEGNSGEKLVDENGTITFSNMEAYVNNGYKVYIAVETKTPQGMITQKAKPTVIVTPMTTSNGSQYLKTINIYPKNITQKLVFTLTKVGDDGQKDGTINPLVGAKFQMYGYTNVPGDETSKKIGGELTTNNAGQLFAENLILGKYYFVELPSEKVDDPSDSTGHEGLYLLGADAKNNSANQLKFEIGEDGVNPDGLKLRYINFKQPTLEKELMNGHDTNNDAHFSFETGEESHHKSTIHIPNDIAGSTEAININSTKYVTKPYSTFLYRDRTQEGLLYVENKGDVVVKDNKGTILRSGRDYILDTIEKDGKVLGFDIDFIINGKTSDTISALAGTDITIEYDMTVTQAAKMAEAIINDAYLDYGTDLDIKTLHDDDALYTYGAKFKKVSSGLFGTGVGAKALEGTEFVVKNAEGKYFTGKFDNDSDSVTENVWSANEADAIKVISDKDGLFEVVGLYEGHYQLIETKATDGYQKQPEPIDFEVTPTAYEEANRKVIENDEKPTAPLTGSRKIAILAAGGMVIGAIGVIVVYYRRRQLWL